MAGDNRSLTHFFRASLLNCIECEGHSGVHLNKKDTVAVSKGSVTSEEGGGGGGEKRYRGPQKRWQWGQMATSQMRGDCWRAA